MWLLIYTFRDGTQQEYLLKNYAGVLAHCEKMGIDCNRCNEAGQWINDSNPDRIVTADTRFVDMG